MICDHITFNISIDIVHLHQWLSPSFAILTKLGLSRLTSARIYSSTGMMGFAGVGMVWFSLFMLGYARLKRTHIL